MTAFDRDLLAAKTAAVERHLARVAAKLPSDPHGLKPSSDASDAVILHLWQAVQLVLDIAFAVCLHRKLSSPGTYGEAFRLLARDGIIDDALADRLSRAAGFRNLVAPMPMRRSTCQPFTPPPRMARRTFAHFSRQWRE